ncbi:unnamed protein product [Phytomonas sp. Hart1]|nr:unnamed protein product [Phytomonas sp. Hart1]|eukprot:CCW69146.1 unnamed protein product [Phytomonas sp. isolate Hart1]
MSLQRYSIAWTDKLIQRTEAHLQDIHSAIHQYYKQEGYPTRVPLHHSAPSKLDDAAPNKEAETEGSYKELSQVTGSGISSTSQPSENVVSLVGSFPLRISAYHTPFSELNAAGGNVGVDLVVTMPASKCSQANLQNGDYLNRRASFLKELGDYFEKLAEEASVKLKGTKRTKSHVEGEQIAEEGEDKHASRNAEHDALERFSRMKVTYAPMHGCYSYGAEKQIIQLRFLRRSAAVEDFNPSSTTSTPFSSSPLHKNGIYEVFHINLHLRCAFSSGRVMGAVGIHKHPYFSHLVLEDYMMPHYLRKIHTLCVNCGGLRRAIVMLKCWAHHTGLMASSSGHPEGLNGFVLAAMVLHLLDEGILLPNMTEENATRTVWVRITHGYFTSPSAESATIPVKPSAEERGEVAVLRLKGEMMNLLFRTSLNFFKTVVEQAAKDALGHRSAFDIFTQHPFQSLHLRHDVALIAHGAWASNDTSTDDETKANPDNSTNKRTDNKKYEDNDRNTNDINKSINDRIKKASVYFSPSIAKPNAVRDVIQKAMGNRIHHVLVWMTSPNDMQVAAQLVNESEGRSRLTRGPPIEDAEAVADFNAFWGTNITSTRQFPDGGIYRCVLWHLAEDEGIGLSGNPASSRAITPLSASLVLRHVVQYALRKHIEPNTTVSVLFGGFDDFLTERIGAEWRDALPLMQGSLYQASQDIQQMVSELPKSVLPCKITDFSFVAASERNTEVFPARPHLALTYTSDYHNPGATNHESSSKTEYPDERYVGICTAPSIDPIYSILSIDDKGKIPDTIEAIEMMRGAICAQLAKFFNQHFRHGISSTSDKSALTSDFVSSSAKDDGSSNQPHTSHPAVLAFATKQSVDIIYKGYFFRIFISHYREVSLLRALQRDAEANMLERKFFWTPQHAKYLSSIVYGHQSYAKATRLAKRWLSAMLMYEFVLPEAVELLVAHAYLSENVHTVPKTATLGFLRFIQLLATHDWTTPLVLPFTDESKTAAAAAELVRELGPQQAMYIATPYAPTTSPFTLNTPRPMIMSRLVQLANRALSLIMGWLLCSDGSGGRIQDIESGIFHTSTLVFDFCVRLHPQLILHPDRALWQPGYGEFPQSQVSVEANNLLMGPVSEEGLFDVSNTTVRRISMLDELKDKESMRKYILALTERDPAAHAVQTIRTTLRDQAMVFYDALSPLFVYIVAITGSHALKHSQAMHETVVRVCRGAVLAVPAAAAFNRITTARGLTASSGPSRASSLEARKRLQHSQVPRQRHAKKDGEDGEKNSNCQRSPSCTHDAPRETKRTSLIRPPKPQLKRRDRPAKLDAQDEAENSIGEPPKTFPTSLKQKRDRISSVKSEEEQPQNDTDLDMKKVKRPKISSVNEKEGVKRKKSGNTVKLSKAK